MAYFYDQDNPHASRETNNFVSSESSYYEEQRGEIVSKSTYSQAQRDRAKVIKAQQRKQARQRRLALLCAACLVVGGVATETVGNIVSNIKSNSAVYSSTMDFRKNVVNPNTHRTWDNEHYYYDYDDIARYIQEDGRDFSTELYKAYSVMGEYQTNKVLDYTNYESVEAYATSAGFKDIDEWAKSERNKISIQSELLQKQEELAEMHSELNGGQAIDTMQAEYGGK